MRAITGCALGAMLLLAGGGAAAQDSRANASAVVRESGEAAGALAESGVKTAVGVTALPLKAVSAGASVAGAALIGTGSLALQGAAASARVASDSTAYSRAPLTVDEEVVVAAQPAPQVPYDARGGGGVARRQP